jgi:bacterial leucyl aminopeptidase
LRGSNAIAADYLSRGVNVVGVTQFDMTNFKQRPTTMDPNPEDIWLMQDFTNGPQNVFLQNLITTYTGATFNSSSSCGYGCSDHAAWHNRGFAASMPFEARMGQHNQALHTVNDTLARSGNNANQALKFARLGAAYVAELAKGTLDGQPPANTPPSVSISSPTAGSTVGTQVTLAGASNDAQDGNLSGSIRWSSNVGGSLGQGASVNVTLAAGAHTVTATVTDSAGATSTSTVSFTVSTGGGGPLFSDNFEGTLGWTVTGLWHKVTNSTCASPGYASAVSSLYYGQDATCNYVVGTARTQGTALSPAISGVTTASAVSFKYFRRVEGGAGSWDATSLQVVAGGTTTTLWTRTSSTPSTTTWQDSGAISLAQFNGQSIRLQLRFDSVDGTNNNFTGWLVDDVVVTR